MAVWHAEVTALVLRRYQADDAAAAFASGAPYDGIAVARMILGKASVGPMLVRGPDLTRDDHRQIERILREHGAVELEITRHGRMVARR